jgi:hypothetical protein
MLLKRQRRGTWHGSRYLDPQDHTHPGRHLTRRVDHRDVRELRLAHPHPQLVSAYLRTYGIHALIEALKRQLALACRMRNLE